jgi:hypothetical protein
MIMIIIVMKIRIIILNVIFTNDSHFVYLYSLTLNPLEVQQLT